MSLENLLLNQQRRETQRNLERIAKEEEDRQKRAGLFSSIGSGLGGFLGAMAMAPFTGGASLLGAAALTGLGATGGSLIGSRIGLETGGGRRSDATDLGMNRSALSGELKEFSQDVKDRYSSTVDQFQDALNNRILSSALQTGIKAAAFNYGNNLLKPQLPDGQVVDASGNVVAIPQANIAGAQAYNPKNYRSALMQSNLPFQRYSNYDVPSYDPRMISQQASLPTSSFASGLPAINTFAIPPMNDSAVSSTFVSQAPMPRPVQGPMPNNFINMVMGNNVSTPSLRDQILNRAYRNEYNTLNNMSDMDLLNFLEN